MPYHISPRSGEPGHCKAAPGNCPFASETDHYETKEAARTAYENSMAAGSASIRKPATVEVLYSPIESPFNSDDYTYLVNGSDTRWLRNEYRIIAKKDGDTSELVVLDEDSQPRIKALVDTSEIPKALDSLSFQGAVHAIAGTPVDERSEKLYADFLAAGGEKENDLILVAGLYRYHSQHNETEGFFNPPATRKTKGRELEKWYGPQAVEVAKKIAATL